MEELVLKDKTLLVVDDEADLREIVSSELEFMGAKVLQAANISVAKSLMEKQKFDLIVSDIRMPGGTGIDLLNHVKARTSHEPPMILITGFADISVEDAFNQGAEALLSKPFKLEELIDVATKLTSSTDERFNQSLKKVPKKLHAQFSHTIDELLNQHQCAIGRGGISLIVETTTSKWEIGDLIHFNLKFKDIELSGEAICRWWKPHFEAQKATFGLEFTNLSDDTLHYLKNFWLQRSIIPFIPTLN